MTPAHLGGGGDLGLYEKETAELVGWGVIWSAELPAMTAMMALPCASVGCAVWPVESIITLP